MECFDRWCKRKAKKWVETVSRGKIIPLCGIHARIRHDWFRSEYPDEDDVKPVLEVENKNQWIQPGFHYTKPLMVWCWITKEEMKNEKTTKNRIEEQ